MELSGEYIVYFKHPEASKQSSRIYKFIGKCENFTPVGLCAFSNNNKEMLLVNYRDVVQMRLKDKWSVSYA